MAVKNKNTLKSDLNSSFPDNTSKQITPQVLRNQQVDTIDSPVNLAETALQTMAGPLDATNYSKAGNPIIPLNEVVINSPSDLPTPVDLADGLGTAYRLNNARYRFGASMSLAFPIAPTASVGNVFIDGGDFSNIVYTGSGAFIRANTTNKWGTLLIENAIIVGIGSNDIFDITGTGVQLFNSFFTIYQDFNSMGTIGSQILNQFKSITFIDCGKMTMDSNNINYFLAIAVITTSPTGDAYFRIQGSSGSTVFQNLQATPLATDSAFDFDAAYTGFINISGSNIIDGDGFKAGSLDQTNPLMIVDQVRGIPKSMSIAYLHALNQAAAVTTIAAVNTVVRINATYSDDAERFTTDAAGNSIYIGLEDVKLGIACSLTGTVSTGTRIPFNFYICKGNTGNTITAAADGGGGQVVITTSLAHGYSNGDRIVHEDTTSYNGEFIISNVTSTTYQITDTFVATETGNHYQVLLFTKGSNFFTTTEDSSTAWHSLLDFSTNDKVFLATENDSGSANWLTSNIQILIK